MIVLFDSYGDIIIRGFPGEKLGKRLNSQLSHARRRTGAIIARRSSQIGTNSINSRPKSKNRDYFRLKAND